MRNENYLRILSVFLVFVSFNKEISINIIDKHDSTIIWDNDMLDRSVFAFESNPRATKEIDDNLAYNPNGNVYSYNSRESVFLVCKSIIILIGNAHHSAERKMKMKIKLSNKVMHSNNGNINVLLRLQLWLKLQRSNWIIVDQKPKLSPPLIRDVCGLIFKFAGIEFCTPTGLPFKLFKSIPDYTIIDVHNWLKESGFLRFNINISNFKIIRNYVINGCILTLSKTLVHTHSANKSAIILSVDLGDGDHNCMVINEAKTKKERDVKAKKWLKLLSDLDGYNNLAYKSVALATFNIYHLIAKTDFDHIFGALLGAYHEDTKSIDADSVNLLLGDDEMSSSFQNFKSKPTKIKNIDLSEMKKSLMSSENFCIRFPEIKDLLKCIKDEPSILGDLIRGKSTNSELQIAFTNFIALGIFDKRYFISTLTKTDDVSKRIRDTFLNDMRKGDERTFRKEIGMVWSHFSSVVPKSTYYEEFRAKWETTMVKWDKVISLRNDILFKKANQLECSQSHLKLSDEEFKKLIEGDLENLNKNKLIDMFLNEDDEFITKKYRQETFVKDMLEMINSRLRRAADGHSEFGPLQGDNIEDRMHEVRIRYNKIQKKYNSTIYDGVKDIIDYETIFKLLNYKILTTENVTKIDKVILLGKITNLQRQISWIDKIGLNKVVDFEDKDILKYFNDLSGRDVCEEYKIDRKEFNRCLMESDYKRKNKELKWFSNPSIKGFRRQKHLATQPHRFNIFESNRTVPKMDQCNKIDLDILHHSMSCLSCQKQICYLKSGLRYWLNCWPKIEGPEINLFESIGQLKANKKTDNRLYEFDDAPELRLVTEMMIKESKRTGIINEMPEKVRLYDIKSQKQMLLSVLKLKFARYKTKTVKLGPKTLNAFSQYFGNLKPFYDVWKDMEKSPNNHYSEEQKNRRPVLLLGILLETLKVKTFDDVTFMTNGGEYDITDLES